MGCTSSSLHAAESAKSVGPAVDAHPPKISTPSTGNQTAEPEGDTAEAHGDDESESNITNDGDSETFAEMRALVAGSCNLAIQTAEWRASTAWKMLDDALAEGAADKSSALVKSAQIRQAVKARDDVGLKTAFDAAVTAVGMEYMGAVRVPVKKVLASCELLKLRSAIFSAAMREAVNELLDLLDVAESIGEQCDVEKDFACELLDRLSPHDEPGCCHKTVEEATEATAAKPSSTDWPFRFQKGTRDWNLEMLEFLVGATPTAEDLRAAYRKAALQWHPDRPHNRGVEHAAEYFRYARESYDALRLQLDGNAKREPPPNNGATSNRV